MSSLIEQIEARAGSVYNAYTLLGIAPSTWGRYKTKGEIPEPVEMSIRAHLALSDRAFSKRRERE